jgi:cytochrome c
MPKLQPFLAALSMASIFVAADVQASGALHTTSGCAACHMIDRKLIGPSYKDIAVRYKGRTDALPYLSQRVRKGGPGNWGVVPMSANDVSKLSDADLRNLITWVLNTPP